MTKKQKLSVAKEQIEAARRKLTARVQKYVAIRAEQVTAIRTAQQLVKRAVQLAGEAEKATEALQQSFEALADKEQRDWLSELYTAVSAEDLIGDSLELNHLPVDDEDAVADFMTDTDLKPDKVGPAAEETARVLNVWQRKLLESFEDNVDDDDDEENADA